MWACWSWTFWKIRGDYNQLEIEKCVASLPVAEKPPSKVHSWWKSDTRNLLGLIQRACYVRGRRIKYFVAMTKTWACLRKKEVEERENERKLWRIRIIRINQTVSWCFQWMLYEEMCSQGQESDQASWRNSWVYLHHDVVETWVRSELSWFPGLASGPAWSSWRLRRFFSVVRFHPDPDRPSVQESSELL